MNVAEQLGSELAYKDITVPHITHNANVCLRVIKVKVATIVEGDQKAPFSIATTPRCRGGRYSFTPLLHFTLDTYLILLSVKQRGIKYHFKVFGKVWD